MMDPGPPPKSPKSKGMAYIDPEEPALKPRRTLPVGVRKRVAKEFAEIESVEAARLKAQRTNQLKVRLFDLMARIEDMKQRDVGRSSEVSYEISANLKTTEFIKKPVCAGVLFRYPVQEKHSEWERESWEQMETGIRIDDDKSDDYKFENVSSALDKLEAAHEEELAKARKRDAVLRAMSPEDREALGMGHWKDPDPDGDAKVLASRVIAARPRRK